MTEAEALQLLSGLVAPGDWPELDTDDLIESLQRARRPDAAGNDPRNTTSAAVWQPGTTYVLFDHVRPTAGTGRFLRCVRAGTSAATEPTWPSLTTTSGVLVTDGAGTLRWETCGTTWRPTWALDAAAADCWRRKAAKAAGAFSFTADGHTFQRQQVAANCLRMAAVHARRAHATVIT